MGELANQRPGSGFDNKGMRYNDHRWQSSHRGVFCEGPARHALLSGQGRSSDGHTAKQMTLLDTRSSKQSVLASPQKFTNTLTFWHDSADSGLSMGFTTPTLPSLTQAADYNHKDSTGDSYLHCMNDFPHLSFSDNPAGAYWQPNCGAVNGGSRQRKGSCDHAGSDWEDFRVDIEAFGCRYHRSHGNRRRRCTHQPPGCPNLQQHAAAVLPPRSQSESNYRPRALTVGSSPLDRGVSTGVGIRARSVRLSVSALNPIYRRQSLNSRLRQFCARLKRDPPSSDQRTGWKKYLLNKMAIEMDDFTIQEEQVKLATEVFKKFDKRGQDKISTNDLGPAFRALNLTIKPDLLKEWADQVDDDATGFIDLKGFLIVYGKKLQDDQDEKDLREAFRVLDKNRRGEIDVEDLRWILKSLGDDLTEEEIDEMIRDTDTDGSGFVDFDEFKKLMTSE
nr:unnamed protein product [Spirometra erinaceieuropaei]